MHKNENGPALAKRQETLKKFNIEMCLISNDQLDSNEKVSLWLKSINNDNHTSKDIVENKNHQIKAITENVLVTQQEMPLLANHEEELMEGNKISNVINSNTRPIFMFMQLQGHTRGINLVFDSGASASLICTDNIPGHEMKACRNKDTTVQLHGLGSSNKTAKSWTILLPLANKSMVSTQAYSVPHILGPLTPVNLKPALEVIKKAAPTNKEVQQSQIY